MRPDEQEDRPGHQQQQQRKASFSTIRVSAIADEQPGHERGEDRGEGDLEPGGPLVTWNNG